MIYGDEVIELFSLKSTTLLCSCNLNKWFNKCTIFEHVFLEIYDYWTGDTWKSIFKTSRILGPIGLVFTSFFKCTIINRRSLKKFYLKIHNFLVEHILKNPKFIEYSIWGYEFFKILKSYSEITISSFGTSHYRTTFQQLWW